MDVATDAAPGEPDVSIAEVPMSRRDLYRAVGMVGGGVFIVTFAQTGVLGQFPFRFLFMNQLHMTAEQQAGFIAWATFPWYIKPLAGLFCDAVPLFGTRRRAYLILMGILGCAGWLSFNWMHTYEQFMIATLLLNSVMVVASTVVGGLLVETGQTGGMTGRLSSLFNGTQNASVVIASYAGGLLATVAFIYTAGIGAACLLALVPLAWFLLHEEQNYTVDTEVWSQAWEQLRVIIRSKTMWWAAGLLLLVFVAPGYGLVLTYYQSQVLHFTKPQIGFLQALMGIGGVVSAALYATFCKRFRLLPMIYWGIVLNAVGGLLYVGYHSFHAALFIDTANGFLCYLGIMPLFDLCVRATPKGSESFGWALLMSVYNIAIFFLGQPIGSWLYVVWHHDLAKVALVNTAFSLVALALVPFLPKILTDTREGDPVPVHQ